jgi:hypothetical protein
VSPLRQVPRRAFDRHPALFEPAHVEQIVGHSVERLGRLQRCLKDVTMIVAEYRG